MTSILREFKDFVSSSIMLEEEANPHGGKSLCMKGIFLQADIRNQNQRIYPLHEIQSAVEKIRQKIKSGETILGERDHPSDLNINLDRVSHMIIDMWMEGNNGMGKLKLLPTPPGEVIKIMLESGVKLGVSSRGSGDVDYNGMVRGFEIVTVDVVAQPSAPNAFPRPIYESLYNMTGGMRILNTATDAMHDKHAQKQLHKDVIKFIRDLKI